MASFHQRAPPPNSVATIRPRSSHDGGVPLRYPTVVELHQQIGNLQTQLTGSEDALDREKRRTQRIRAERDDLRREVGQLNQKLQQQAWTIDEHKKKIKEQENQIHEQSIKVDKQTKTIQVQSDTISGKQRTSDRGPFMTPARRDTQRNLTEETPSASAAAARRARVNDQPPPPFRPGHFEPKGINTAAVRPQSKPFAQALVPFGGSAPSQIQRELNSVPSRLAFQENTTSKEMNYMGLLQQIFTLSEAWVRNYASIPNVSRDSKLSSAFMENVTSLAGPNNAMAILSNIQTRRFLVTAYINRTFTRKIFNVTALMGFNKDVDHTLEATRAHFTRKGPSNQRGAVLHAMAKAVTRMMGTAGSTEFLDGKVRARGDRLFEELRLTMHEGANVEAAWREVGELVALSHRLTVGMFSMPYEFTFTFPPPGTAFDPSCMVNYDPAVKGDPVGLQRAGARVRFAVSPCSKKWGAANVPQSLHYAKVLLLA